MPVAEPRHGVDTNQIEVAREAVMLKSVVEHQDLCIKDRNRMMTDNPPIPADQHRDTWRMRSQNE